MGNPDPSPLIAREAVSWQQQLRDAIRDGATLLETLGLPADEDAWSQTAAEQFAVRVPLSFLRRMRFGDRHDPLLKQVLAVPQENQVVAGWGNDPLEEITANPVPGLIHKYHGRVLLLPTSACAVNCRYCFRRHFPYSDNRLDDKALSTAIDYIAADTSLKEVILSGGDPLVLQDNALEQLFSQLADIPHVQRIRIHSRLPVVIPARITEKLLTTLNQPRLRSIMVIHCNHPNELDDELALALNRLRQAGIAVLNQSVLLRGVNDDADVLVSLQQRLFDEAGVLPYYLHLPDKVAGTWHFDVEEQRARALLHTLRMRLPGFLVPRLAREIPGEGAKHVVSG